jgi:hypothetical protein
MKTILKKEWTFKGKNNDHGKVIRKIKKYLLGKTFAVNSTETGQKMMALPFDFKALENLLGFAYTSSGDCAGIWLCNAFDVYIDSDYIYKIDGFILSESGDVYINCSGDVNGQESVINIKLF